jgi:hypothetical protein
MAATPSWADPAAAFDRICFVARRPVSSTYETYACVAGTARASHLRPTAAAGAGAYEIRPHLPRCRGDPDRGSAQKVKISCAPLGLPEQKDECSCAPRPRLFPGGAGSGAVEKLGAITAAEIVRTPYPPGSGPRATGAAFASDGKTQGAA